MIITAFDLATATGVCDGVGGGNPRVFSWYLDDAGKDRPARLHALAGFLNRYFTSERCDAVVYEAPLPLSAMNRIGAQDATVAFLRGAIGVLEERCYARNKPVEALNVQDARASVLGWRRNPGGMLIKSKRGAEREETTKEIVLRQVCQLGVKVNTDNEADAYVIWRFACNLQNPNLAISSTPLFRTEGGNPP